MAAYCRVSTDQEEQENSFENQVAYYTEYINSKPEYTLAGIFADEGISGTGTKKRVQFQKMISECEAGNIDLIITKSISRFARNTADCLQYSRKLKNLGIPVVFEKEHISTTDQAGELLFTILSSLAQEESHNISTNCAWGIRSKYRKGIPHLTGATVMGYDTDKDGKFVINPEQAKLVRRIYREFEEGMYTADIAAELNAEGICGVKGKPAWVAETVRWMLQNELYKGDLLMQKFYTADYLTKKQVRNDGKYEQYYVEKNHDPIIPPEEWEAVQQEIERRKRFMAEHGFKRLGNCTCDCAFLSRVFCAKCGGKYGRTRKKDCITWMCLHKLKCYGATCKGSPNINEKNLRRGFVIAWNSVVEEREQLLPRWEEMQETGTALEKLRAKQMTELTASGKITTEIPEHTRMVLEYAEVISNREIRVHFLDGTVKQVRVTDD